MLLCVQHHPWPDGVASRNMTPKGGLTTTIPVEKSPNFAAHPSSRKSLRWIQMHPWQIADSPDSISSPTVTLSWKGGGSLAAQVAGGKSELHWARSHVTSVRPEIHAGGHDVRRGRQTVPQRIYRPRRKVRVRVKRRFKRPPPATQEAGHGKPLREQDQIGDLRCGPHRIGESRSGSGYRSLREMTLSLAQARKTEFGLQPFQDTISPPDRGEIAQANPPNGLTRITAPPESAARSRKQHPAPP